MVGLIERRVTQTAINFMYKSGNDSAACGDAKDKRGEGVFEDFFITLKEQCGNCLGNLD